MCPYLLIQSLGPGSLLRTPPDCKAARNGKPREAIPGVFVLLKLRSGRGRLLPRGLARQERELLLLLLTLDDDGRLDQDQQHVLVLGHRAVGEQPLEERALRQDGRAHLLLDLAGRGLTAQEQRAAVREGDRGANLGQLDFRLPDEARR